MCLKQKWSQFSIQKDQEIDKIHEHGQEGENCEGN